MDAIVKSPRRVMPNFAKRPETCTKSKTTRVLDEDAIFVSMFEDENIDFDEKLEFLRRGP